jgi:hypothetical protein
MSADGRAEESPQQGIQSIEVGAQVLRALEAGRGPMALSEVARNCAAGQISAELGYRPA